MKQQIETVIPTKIVVHGQEIAVTSHFKLTMNNGKMFAVISETSTQSCRICGITPKNMNNVQTQRNMGMVFPLYMQCKDKMFRMSSS